MAAADCPITVIIPNWNGQKLLAICLQSLSRQTSQEFFVVVVDNGSSDGSVEFVRKHYPQVHCISFPENAGFSAAVNAGINGCRSPWVLLLNNDIEVEENCIACLLEAIIQYPKEAFFALKMLNYHQRELLDGAGDAMLRGGVGYRLGTMEKDTGQYDIDQLVFGACAGAALYNRRLFTTIGLFDEDFFAYLEDVDLNLRACRAGLSCRYLAKARVYHMGSATSGSKINSLTVRLSTKNNINVLAKNYPGPLLLRLFPVIFLYQLAWLFFVVKHRQLPAFLQGWRDAGRQFSVMRGKQRQILATAVKSEPEFARCLRQAERQAIQSIMNRRRQQGKGNLLLQVYRALFG